MSADGSPGTATAAWTSDPVTRPGGDPWDLLVVGGGTAGLVAAQTAAQLGATVLLVERERTGGDCLWTGCVPSKALLAAAHAAADARAASRLGVRTGPVEVDFAAVMAHVRRAVARIEPVDSPGRLRQQGVAVARGDAVLTGPTAAEVDGTPVAFRQAVLATGAAPVVPDVLAATSPLTSDDVWELEALPPRVAVVGGGPVGCELGQALARLGSRVTLIESADRLLARESRAAADAVADALRADGLDLRLGAGVGRSERAEDGTAVLHLEDGERLAVDRVLAAVGRRPRTAGLGLEAAGVALTGDGHVRVDSALRTTSPRIWAAGELTARPAFTHVAGVDGSLAASNSLLGLRRSTTDVVPRVTYTRPEVAAVGVDVDEARSRGLTVRTVAHEEVDRAVAEDDTDGHTSLVLDRRGRVVGGCSVGPRAGEVLAEVLLTTNTGARARTLAGVVHPYPAWSDGPWKAALAQGRADLGSRPARAAVAALTGLRRRWLDLRAR